MKVRTFERGVHPAYNKELTAGRAIEKASLPKTVIIPLHQHAGSPCEPLVKKGDTVAEGQKIGDAQAFITAPVHASISGKVKDIDYFKTPTGTRVLSAVIEGDGSEKTWDTGTGRDLSSVTSEEIRSIVREAGIVGMGGAGFPTSVKLMTPKGKTIDSVIINGCECEPFLTADHRVMVEQAEKVVWGLQALMKAVGAGNGFIGIEDNKEDAVAALREASKAHPGIKVAVLETKYPQGAEKMLIRAVLGRRVPPGKLPLDVGVVVNNVGTAVAVYEAINWGKPLIERVVTVSGNVANPKNIFVRVGTPFKEVLEQCGGVKGNELPFEVLNGGPMMGIAQSSLDVPVVKGTSGITVMAGVASKALEYDPCIRCGGCVDVCPMGLMPYRLGDYGNFGRVAEFKDWAGLSCIECGSCSYVCPSKRPLVQWIRVGKLLVRKAGKPSSV